ncbi:MAG: PAS domain S-box protein [Burkholderiales bacterium]|nr:MAG: PAS domain S-box protein [Burkholderiales bacterium]
MNAPPPGSGPPAPPPAPPFPPLLALESIRDAFYVVDAHWRIVFFNACAERHFGRTREEVLGRTVWEAFPSAAGSPFDAPFVAAMRERAVARVEAESVRRDGRWVEVEASPCGDGMCLQVRDITARKHIELQLLEREARLADADRNKDEFLAVLSHELRNPLAPLTNVLRLLARSAALGTDERALLAMAERQRARLAALVDELLEVTRVSSGKIDLRCEPVSVGSAVREALESVAAEVAARGQRVELAIRAAEDEVLADPVRIAQMLENLLHNAVKYTPRGGEIRVSVRGAGAAVEVEVADDGIGIAPDDLPRIFEPFVQLEAGRGRAEGGLGIGLALVRRLAALHGGAIGVRSEGAGRGAAFTLRLPYGGPGAG